MFPLIIAAALILLSLIGIYYYFFFRRMLNQFGLDHKKKISRIICVVLAVLMAAWASNIRGTGLVAVMYLLMFAVGTDLVSLILRIIPGLREKEHAGFLRVWNLLYRGGILAVLLTVIMVAYGYYNMSHVVRTDYRITTDKLDQGETLRVAMISDLHLGMNMDAAGLDEHLEDIEAASPDLFLLVGDLFDEGTEREDMLKGAELLGNMDTSYGVFYVYGNHDVNQYRSDKAYTPEEMTDVLKAAGIHVLADRTVTLGNGVSVIGRLDRSFGGRKDMAELTAGIPKDHLKILLDHQPADMQEKAEAGIDLQVSGHTHAGQVWPFGQFSEITGFNEINYGLKTYDQMAAVVSSGIAGWGFPIRTAKHCEYVIIDLVGE